jgi:predicted ABC-type ATPase
MPKVVHSEARVAQGGHAVPEDVIRRRYVTGWRNFEQRYKVKVDAWAHYDNSGQTPLLIDERTER